MGYVVTSRMALIDRKDRTTATVLQGQAVPDDVVEEHLAHLLSLNMVAEVDEPPTGGLVNSGEETIADAPADVPAKVATKDEWVRFAVSRGYSQEDAEAATKDQLIERFKG